MGLTGYGMNSPISRSFCNSPYLLPSLNPQDATLIMNTTTPLIDHLVAMPTTKPAECIPGMTHPSPMKCTTTPVPTPPNTVPWDWKQKQFFLNRSFYVHFPPTTIDGHAFAHVPAPSILATLCSPHHILLSASPPHERE